MKLGEFVTGNDGCGDGRTREDVVDGIMMRLHERVRRAKAKYERNYPYSVVENMVEVDVTDTATKDCAMDDAFMCFGRGWIELGHLCMWGSVAFGRVGVNVELDMMYGPVMKFVKRTMDLVGYFHYADTQFSLHRKLFLEAYEEVQGELSDCGKIVVDVMRAACLEVDTSPADLQTIVTRVMRVCWGHEGVLRRCYCGIGMFPGDFTVGNGIPLRLAIGRGLDLGAVWYWQRWGWDRLVHERIATHVRQHEKPYSFVATNAMLGLVLLGLNRLVWTGQATHGSVIEMMFEGHDFADMFRHV